MRVGVLGINHKLANLRLRELLAKSCRYRFTPGFSTHSEHDLILLSTCNRTEIYFFSEDLTATHSYILNILRSDVPENFDQKLYSYFGKDCLAHLCRVTTGLDSAIITETEIQGQVKDAYELAHRNSPLPFELHYLFQKALGISKKIRTILPTKPGLPDIEHAVLQTGQAIFPNTPEVKILFIGASAINEKILCYLKHKNFSNITICNRSPINASLIANKYSISIIPWEQVNTWHSYDWIIFGTKASNHLINVRSSPSPLCKMAPNFRKKFIIDLGVPRNVDPALSRYPDITLLNIDQINRRLKIRRQSLNHSLDMAETMLSQAIHQHISLFHEKEKTRLRIYASTA